MSSTVLPIDPTALKVYRDDTPIIKDADNHRIYEACTSIGLRPAQEDRFVLVPKFFVKNVVYCGVFDGTVGDFASDYVCRNIINHLCNTEEIAGDNSILQLASTAEISDKVVDMIRSAMRKSFVDTDRSLIAACAERELHYASSTGVAAMLYHNVLTVGHIGDSKACIAKIVNGVLHTEWLTIDHKPHMPHELRRIEAAGGSLAWLHGNKPYIRGGDFFSRQALGHHPKQLNYSRAFGGKDLKMYGLSAEPDISQFELAPDDKLVLIASDGLWDVLSAEQACDIALRARREDRSATKDIVKHAIDAMPIKDVRDNITVIALFL